MSEATMVAWTFACGVCAESWTMRPLTISLGRGVLAFAFARAFIWLTDKFFPRSAHAR